MRRKQQEKIYYQDLMESTNEADELYIFGPAEAKENFAKFLNKNTGFKSDIKAVDSADSMTENQKVAKVKAFFG